MATWIETLKDIANNRLIAYFLILWGATFFFSALSGLMWVAEGYASSADAVFETLESLAEIGCKGLFGKNILCYSFSIYIDYD